MHVAAFFSKCPTSVTYPANTNVKKGPMARKGLSRDEDITLGRFSRHIPSLKDPVKVLSATAL